MREQILEILKGCSSIECEDCIIDKLTGEESGDCGIRVFMRRLGLTDYNSSEEIADRIVGEIG